MMPPLPVVVLVAGTHRRCRAAAAVAAAEAANSCRATAGGPGRSGRLTAAGSRRGGDGPCPTGQDGAVLLARRWLG